LDDNTLQVFIKAKEVSDKVKAALAEVIKRKAALAALTARRAELERQVKVIFEEQNRIRQNMTELPKESDLFRRYVTKFNEQEDSVEKLRGQITAAQEEETASGEALIKFFQELELS
jgi:hypothetical protein